MGKNSKTEAADLRRFFVLQNIDPIIIKENGSKKKLGKEKEIKMENKTKEAFKNMEIALRNAIETTEIALEELQKLKFQNEVEPYMKAFDKMIKDLMPTGYEVKK